MNCMECEEKLTLCKYCNRHTYCRNCGFCGCMVGEVESSFMDAEPEKKTEI
jgi:hypothetical protein